ncbi:NEAT domain-containing protein [Virgibacillus sp. MSJ-26]|uniref:NEAT domain-containing protein n=1 Tax=Virgibacillus sp. MSJ-26 TaxID=2841522 RepID=UPI001C123E5C|nr:NEAT domain-containing protein [Virgibacillus sp. MSJ-26]MBU5467579.1 NEAT domain-containing protein [Virgibacillus sp. MSJ-26]
MAKRFSSFIALTAMVLTLSLFILPQEPIFADIADGTYEVNYEMKEAGSDNTSIADGYFSKPATLTVENGVKTIQLTVTGADMIKSLSAPNGPVDVVSDNGDTRTVKFNVDGDFSQPVSMEMHIKVPDLYDTTHTARAVFDVSGLDQAGSTASKEDSSDEDNATPAAGSNKAEENPPTGDSTPIVMYTILLVGSVVALVAARKLRPAKN